LLTKKRKNKNFIYIKFLFFLFLVSKNQLLLTKNWQNVYIYYLKRYLLNIYIIKKYNKLNDIYISFNWLYFIKHLGFLKFYYFKNKVLNLLNQSIIIIQLLNNNNWFCILIEKCIYIFVEFIINSCALTVFYVDLSNEYVKSSWYQRMWQQYMGGL